MAKRAFQLLILSLIFICPTEQLCAQIRPSPLAAAENLSNAFAAVIGGAGNCGDLNLHELDAVGCGTRSVFQGNRADMTRFVYFAEQLVLNDMAGDAQAAVDCMMPTLNAYSAAVRNHQPTAATDRFNNAAFAKYRQIEPQLLAGQSKINSLYAQLNQNLLICGDKPSSMCIAPIRQSFKAAVGKIQANLDILTTNVPLGNTDQVRQALLKLSSAGPASSAMFASAFSGGVVSTTKDLATFQKALNKGKQVVDSTHVFYNFSLIPSVREQFLSSDEYAARLKRTAASASVQNKLLCRRDAEFKRGPARAKWAAGALTVLSLGATAAEAAVAGGIVEAGAGFGVGLGEAHAAKFALQLGLTASDVAYVGASVASGCGATPTLVTGSASGHAPNRCTPEGGFEGLIADAGGHPCAIALAQAAFMVASPVVAAVRGARTLPESSASLAVEAQAAKAIPHRPTVTPGNAQVEIWRRAEAGDAEGAQLLQEKIATKLMTEKPVSVTAMSVGSQSAPHMVAFADGTRGIWKAVGDEQSIEGEIGSYTIDRELGSHLVPITVKRTFDGKPGTLQLFVDSNEAAVKVSRPREDQLLDTLTSNIDRGSGNYLVRDDGRKVFIDNGQAFKVTHIGEGARVDWQIEGELKKLDASRRRVAELKAETPKKGIEHLVQQQVTKAEKKLADETTERKQTIQKLLGRKEAYNKLVSTTPAQWRSILDKKISPEQFEGFLKMRQVVIDAVNDAQKRLGSDIFSAP